jgi:geranylgeranyl diphosphate synthase, type I
MVQGKTAALLSACAQLGAILGRAGEMTIAHFADFGRDLGLAFQVQDDILGIWGDEARTGKSAASDLVEGKNSLPVLYGVGRRGRFAERWKRRAIRPEEVPGIAQMLIEEGAQVFAEDESRRLTKAALASLQKACTSDGAAAALLELTNQLLSRES